jgi:hypothetical protein
MHVVTVPSCSLVVHQVPPQSLIQNTHLARFMLFQPDHAPKCRNNPKKYHFHSSPMRCRHAACTSSRAALPSVPSANNNFPHYQCLAPWFSRCQGVQQHSQRMSACSQPSLFARSFQHRSYQMYSYMLNTLVTSDSCDIAHPSSCETGELINDDIIFSMLSTDVCTLRTHVTAPPACAPHTTT